MGCYWAFLSLSGSAAGAVALWIVYRGAKAEGYQQGHHDGGMKMLDAWTESNEASHERWKQITDDMRERHTQQVEELTSLLRR